MNKKTKFNNIAYKLIYVKFKDFQKTLNIKADDSSYDPTAGEWIDFEKDGVDIPGIPLTITDTMFNPSDLRVGDLAFLIHKPELTRLGITELFLQTDVFTIDNIEYTLIALNEEASESTYTLQLRKQ